MFADRSLDCCRCGCTFVFSAKEQEYFASRSLSNEPKRCQNCRVLERLQRSGKSTSSASKVKCADCGVDTIVPFQPKSDRPIYCNACWKDKHHDAKRQTASA